MGLYDGIKDVAKVVQQADNIELYKKLLDLSAQALDLQDEISNLKKENAELKRQKDIEQQIERYNLPYLTLKDDENKLKYCTNCWDDSHKLIQLHCDEESGEYYCPCCKDKGIYDDAKNKEYVNKKYAAIANSARPAKSWINDY